MDSSTDFLGWLHCIRAVVPSVWRLKLLEYFMASVCWEPLSGAIRANISAIGWSLGCVSPWVVQLAPGDVLKLAKCSRRACVGHTRLATRGRWGWAHPTRYCVAYNLPSTFPSVDAISHLLFYFRSFCPAHVVDFAQAVLCPLQGKASFRPASASNSQSQRRALPPQIYFRAGIPIPEGLLQFQLY